uniref:Uncharacterized protein n=1 Tax=Porcine adenovirus A serotype 3 TaxID=35265 RepID=Q3HS74_ADEP3|nr:unknown [Porcine adenovirus 3]
MLCQRNPLPRCCSKKRLSAARPAAAPKAVCSVPSRNWRRRRNRSHRRGHPSPPTPTAAAARASASAGTPSSPARLVDGIRHPSTGVASQVGHLRPRPADAPGAATATTSSRPWSTAPETEPACAGTYSTTTTSTSLPRSSVTTNPLPVPAISRKAAAAAAAEPAHVSQLRAKIFPTLYAIFQQSRGGQDALKIRNRTLRSLTKSCLYHREEAKLERTLSDAEALFEKYCARQRQTRRYLRSGPCVRTHHEQTNPHPVHVVLSATIWACRRCLRRLLHPHELAQCRAFHDWPGQ